MNRSEFLRLSGLGLISLCLDPLVILNALAADHAQVPVLVLIELQGGNDGLNTLIPYNQPAYYKLRPQLALPKSEILPLSAELGLHPALQALKPLWQRKQMAWALGVGYSQPNRSHFRSIEIWDSASQADEYLEHGWLGRVLPQLPANSRSLADGILLGETSAGPLNSLALRTLALNAKGRLPRSVSRPVNSSQMPESLHHIQRVEATLNQGARELNQRLSQAGTLPVKMPDTPLGRQLGQVAMLIRAGIQSPVYKLTHGGFDTHRQQDGIHGRLLRELAEALGAFHQALEPQGHWQRTLVMTYSEFGRRVAENASGGTDHGTASPQLILGGRVKGGLYGQQPQLEDLVNQDLRHHVDFRSLYQTIARRWWGLKPFWPESQIPVLNFI